MDIRALSIAILMHFTFVHSSLFIFHCSIGIHHVYPIVHRVFPAMNFQFAASVPHDILLTTLLVYIAYVQTDRPTLDQTFLALVPPTLICTCLSELRVAFYFEQFPSQVLMGMFILRSIVLLCANAAALYVSVGLT